ncbi:MAG: sulfatase-like hydrolase/transferase [Micromonosporaceae bacterium]
MTDPVVPDSRPAPRRPRPAAGRRPGRGELVAFLELFALCGFVVVQPMLSVVGASPDFFIFHGVSGSEIALLVAVFALVPPVALWGLGLLSRLAGRRVRAAIHLATVSTLVLLLVIEVGKQLTPVRGLLLTAPAGVLAALLVAAYLRWDWTRQALRIAAVGPVVFALLFAFASPSSAVVFPDRPADATTPATVTGPNPPVVMIILDELPLLSLLDEQARIDAERYPNFARLAADATWYRNATAASGWTPYALPAMLTGVWPERHVAPHYSQFPDNLFTLAAGVYRVEAHESIAHLCPPWQCGDLAERSKGGLTSAFREVSRLVGELVSPVDSTRNPYEDFVEPTVAERLQEAAAAEALGPEFRFDQVGVNQPARFQQFLSRLQAAPPPGDDRPSLHFLHLLMPHTPWRYLASGLQYEAPRLPVDGPWWGRLALQRLEQQLQYTDTLIGEVLDELQRSGRYDETLLVVTADHGATLTPGEAGVRQLRQHRPDAQELVWVPLFIKRPGQTRGEVDDRNWQQVDLLPTVADLMGLAVPWKVDGISWVREQRTTGEKTFVSELDDVHVLDGDALFAEMLADPGAIPPLPPAPLPELVGTEVGGYRIVDGPEGVEVEDLAAFRDVRPADGVVPALVSGTLPEDVPDGTPVAIAVNGRIGAVVPAVVDGGGHRFAGLIEDATLFRSGENRLELFLVAPGSGDTYQLQRLL